MNKHSHHAHVSKKETDERKSLPFIQLEEKIKKTLLNELENGQLDPVMLGCLCEDLGRAETIEELKTLLMINTRSYKFLQPLVA